MKYQSASPKTLAPDSEYVEVECKSFVRLRGYVTNVTDEEANFPISYSIMAYRDVEQVERLLRSIYRPHNYYCIHVDRSADRFVRRGLAAVAACLPHVEIASRLVNVEWGLWSVVEAELVGMNLLYETAIFHLTNWSCMACIIYIVYTCIWMYV